MENNLNKTGAVILAAGMGKRMQSAMLKVMHTLRGRPLIDYVVTTVEKSGIETKPVVVVCADDPAVQNFLGERADYVVQKDRLGTGHAVRMAEDCLKDKVGQVVVLYGDMPFISAESVKRLIARHLERNNTLSLITFIVPDFAEWRTAFKSFSRIIRGGDGHIVRDVQAKDAAEAELKIKELNPGVYCFQSDWLWKNLKKIETNNIQKEYYLTDLIQMAIEQGEKISSISIEPKEALGINTKEDLESAEKL